MLFADADPSTGIIGYLVQGGGLAIMGVFFLWVWPRLEKERNDSHQAATNARNESTEKLVTMVHTAAAAEREASNERHAALAMAVEKLAAAMPTICKSDCEDYAPRRGK